MQCPKCKGLMIYEKFVDYNAGGAAFWGWRCASCGTIIDDVIVQNRNNPPPRKSYKIGYRNKSRAYKSPVGVE